MAVPEERKDQQESRAEEDTAMEDQGPSYSSSYNESTPGEITENRRAGMLEEESRGEGSFGSSQP